MAGSDIGFDKWISSYFASIVSVAVTTLTRCSCPSHPESSILTVFMNLCLLTSIPSVCFYLDETSLVEPAVHGPDHRSVRFVHTVTALTGRRPCSSDFSASAIHIGTAGMLTSPC